MSYPNSFYESKIDHFDDLEDGIVLTLAAPLTAGGYLAKFNEIDQLARLKYATLLTCKTEVDGKFDIISFAGLGQHPGEAYIEWPFVERMDHAAGEQFVQDPTSFYLSTIRYLISAAQQFHALLVGTLPLTCEAGECCIVQQGRTGAYLYYAIAKDTWFRLDNSEHNSLQGLDQDDHPIYHTDSRKQLWHDTLPGKHLINPATHNHNGQAGMGAPVSKLFTGITSELPVSPSVAGQVFYDEVTGILYIAQADPLMWQKYSVIPSGTIIMFDPAIYPGGCPPGWKRYSSLDGKSPRGAPAGQYGGFIHGGSTKHNHTLPDLITHTHTLPGESVEVYEDGGHSHTTPGDGGSGSSYAAYENSYPYSITYATSSVGSHVHAVSLPATTTTATGTTSTPLTEDATNNPPTLTVVFCQKDG